MSNDNNLSVILLKQTFELKMMLHKIKQINTPLRLTKVVFVYLRLLISVFHSKQKVHVPFYRQNYTIINQNQQNHIPLNARSWNDLKRSLDGILKK